jgi:hypothetical protein
VNTKTASLRQLERQYERLRRDLGQTGYISQGSVQDRQHRGYQWTRKASQKTVTVALTAAQFDALKEAIANQRKLRKTLQQMEKLSREIIFQSHPHPSRRKHLNKKVLGLI